MRNTADVTGDRSTCQVRVLLIMKIVVQRMNITKIKKQKLYYGHLERIKKPQQKYL
jgi:hypothetical protein